MDTPTRRATSAIDPTLLASVVKGDQQAFSQLYDHSSALLYTLAFRILGNRDEAAELLQDVYLEVWRKVARYDIGRGTPIAWLITLTRSRAIDRLRARAVREARMPHCDWMKRSLPAWQIWDQAPTRHRPIRSSESRWVMPSPVFRRRNSKRSNWRIMKGSRTWKLPHG